MKRIKPADWDNPTCARCGGGKKWVDWTLEHKDFLLCAQCSRFLEGIMRDFVLTKQANR
jgi:hypothetical protein